MSLAEDYLKAKRKREEEEKKKKQQEEEDYAPISDVYSFTQGMFEDAGISEIRKRVHDNSIGTVMSGEKDTEEKGERTWFQKGGKTTEDKVVGTTRDAGTDFFSGLVGLGEKIVDWGASIAPSIAKGQYYANGGGYNLEADKIFEESNKKFKDEVIAPFVEKDLYDEQKVAKHILAGMESSVHLQNTNGYTSPKQMDFANQMRQDALQYMDTQMEADSILGDKSDALIQSAGQLAGTSALAMAGVPWYLTTGASTWGAESENALKQGATLEEANLSGMISAGAELITEKISGGIKIPGIGKTADDAIVNALGRNISNKVVRTLAKMGVDMVGEGAEEVLSGVISALGQKLTYASEKEWEELFSMEDVWESFIGGAVLGGAGSVTSAAQGKINGVDSVTDMTADEEAVVRELYNKAIEQSEKDGKTKNNTEKRKLWDKISEDMEKGYISAEDIESVLGGEKHTLFTNEAKRYFGSEDFKAYKKAKDAEEAARKEFDPLVKMKQGEMTGEQIYRRDELKKILDESKVKELETKLSPETERIMNLRNLMRSEVFERVKGTKLEESYNELARKQQKYEVDVEQYEGKAKETVQNIIDSGLGDNSNQFHELVDFLAKISNDKGVTFNFTKTELLKGTKHYKEGYITNGFVDDNGNVVLNKDSNNAIHTIVGHEVTHVLKKGMTPENYKVLESAVSDYCIAKEGLAKYKARLKAAEEAYKGKKNTTAEEEVTADIVGEYLFTDSEFVNKLSVDDRSTFEKIYDEIKYLWKVATAGTHEKRELERVKKIFDKAWRENVKGKETKTEATEKSSNTEATIDPENDSDLDYESPEKYSVSVTDPEMIEFLENQEHITTYKAMVLIDGKLYPPMASKVKGEDGKYHLSNGREIGEWMQAEEDTTNIKFNDKGIGYYDLKKDDGGTVRAAYNPYEHSSNLVLNDQFEAAYKRENLVTVECVIPKSEIDSPYTAEYAKDSTGVMDWHSGVVAGKLSDNKRSVYLSRYLKATRILSDAEVAQKYKEIVGDLAVPFNVVSPGLLTELENVGVNIDYDGSPQYQYLQRKAAEREARKTLDSLANDILDAKSIQYSYSAIPYHKQSLDKNFDLDNASLDLETIHNRYDKIIGIWEKLGGELDSKFLNDWNNKVERPFTVFKAQAGYKYNVELSSMCKKGVPLFEAIDTIVKNEVMKELNTDVLGKEEKEILYDILKQHHFEIPCAICYVEQARQREGVIIDAFLNGKADNSGDVKLGWNQVLDSIQKEMKANGVDHNFAFVSRDIATDKYMPADLKMDEKTYAAFAEAVKKIANEEITRYNKESGKRRKLLKEVTPEAVKECFKGTLPSNLKIFKVLLTEPSSRFKIQDDLLYSSMTTKNLTMAHNALYGLFNSQGGVSGYKTKQAPTVYWGEILGKKWKPEATRKEGGIRNQSNSDFQMYTLLDQAQMYMDFSAKGYYLQAYTKVLSELKLFGLSRGKINASLIPKVKVYRNADGSVDVERTMANAGLDENGNLFFDDIEGINHKEAFMLLEDPEYSKNIGGICIGYSDNHIRKLLDDDRVQLIIGFHDKTNDPDKRYRGARYAKNYNGLNEAVNKDGKTVHIGFNPFVQKAEKKFQYNQETESFEGTVKYNGKTYTADDIPRLATDLYLESCAKKGYTPAYTDFSGHKNYYKLLADFSLYDSQGHYAPHQKVAYNMPDTVPYLDADGNKQYMDTEEYIKIELQKELAVRDALAEALADTSENGIIPQFKTEVNKRNIAPTQYSFTKDSDGNDLTDEQQEFFRDSVIRDENGSLMPMYHGTKKGGFTVFDGGKDYWYFTKDKKYADTFEGRREDGEYYPLVQEGIDEGYYTPQKYAVYLNVKNPFITDDIDVIEDALYWDKTLPEQLRKQGYDALMLEDMSQVIVLNPNQIKNMDNTNPSEDNDIRYSLTKDSEGKELTTEQAEFFKDSKVTDSEGNLKVVYHGSPADFNTFSLDYLGTNGTAEGYGFYFTDRKNVAEGYANSYEVEGGGAGKLFEVYLNIKKPLSDSKLTMTKAQFKKFLTKLNGYVDSNGDRLDVLSNYGDVEWEGLNAVLNTALETEYDYCDSDVDLVQSIINGCGDMKAVFNVLRDTVGYDGIIVNEASWGGDQTIYIAFHPDQIKNTDNAQPTTNPDIRYSLSPEGEEPGYGYVPSRDIGVNDEFAPIREDAESVKTESIAPETPSIAPEEPEKTTTVSERVQQKIDNTQAELDKNRELREDSLNYYDEEIAKKQAEYDSKKNKNSLTAQGILRSIERLKRLRANSDADFSKRISDLEQRVERYHSQEYSRAEHRREKMSGYTKMWEDLIGDTSTWKDMPLGVQYKTKTLRRILRNVVRGVDGKADIQLADDIYDELETKYDHNEASLKKESIKLKSPFEELKLTSEEDVYAQMLGELRHNPETTLSEDVVKEYYEKHKKKINPQKVDKAIEEARKLYDDLIVRVNEVLKEQGFKEIPYRKGYFPHFTNPKQTWWMKALNWKPVDNEIPTSIAGLTETFKPQRSWQKFDKRRYSDQTDYSLYKGLDTYIHGALDWVYHIEDLQKRRALENHLRYIHSDEGIQKRIEEIKNGDYDADEAQDMINAVLNEARNPLSGFVRELMNRTNTLANKKAAADRAMEDDLNRKIYSTMTNLNNRVSANMVVGSLSSAMTNFIPMVQSWHEVSPVYTVKGLGDMVRSTIKDDGIVEKSDFLTNRLRNEENLYKTGWDKAIDKMGFLMETVDNITAQTVWRSKYLQNLSEGMSESAAIKNADQFAKNVMAGRSRGNMPTIFDAKNPVTKLFTAFQLEVANQYGYMFDDVVKDSKTKTRLVKGYATAFLGAYAYNALYSALVGRDAAFDPIRIIEDLMRGLFDDEEENEGVLMDFGEDILQEVPFVGGLLGGGRVPIQSALPYAGDSTPFVNMINDVTEGNWGSFAKEFLKPLYYLVLPAGGGQVKKTIEGLSMYAHPIDGSYTDSGNLRFPVEDHPLDVAQAALFGQYSSKNARDYFDNDWAPLGDKQITEYSDLGMDFKQYHKIRDGLKDYDTLAEKVDYIHSLDISDEQKNILVNNLTDRKTPIDMSNYGEYGDLEEYDFAQKNPGKYAIAKVYGYDQYKAYTDHINDITGTKDSNGKTISGSRKDKVFKYINSLDLSKEEKMLLFKSEYPADDSYNMEILKWLDSMYSLDEIKPLLEELGFHVYNGRVIWD